MAAAIRARDGKRLRPPLRLVFATARLGALLTLAVSPLIGCVWMPPDSVSHDYSERPDKGGDSGSGGGM